MISNALLATTVIFVALAFWLLQQLAFLSPYRRLIFEKYGEPVLLFAGLLFLNLFAAVYLVCRKVFLKDTGRKLAHLDKQLRTGETISEELSRRLEE